MFEFGHKFLTVGGYTVIGTMSATVCESVCTSSDFVAYRPKRLRPSSPEAPLTPANDAPDDTEPLPQYTDEYVSVYGMVKKLTAQLKVLEEDLFSARIKYEQIKRSFEWGTQQHEKKRHCKVEKDLESQRARVSKLQAELAKTRHTKNVYRARLTYLGLVLMQMSR